MKKENTVPPRRLVRIGTLANEIGYSDSHIRFMARTNRIPVERFGRSLRFNPEAVIEALRQLK